jgi:hypothetical protein
MFLQQMKDATPQANGQSDLRHLFAYRPDAMRHHLAFTPVAMRDRYGVTSKVGSSGSLELPLALSECRPHSR